MSTQDSVAVAQEVWDAWNAHDLDRYVQLLDDEHVLESDSLPRALRGRDAARERMEQYLKAFPDLHFTIDQLIGSGDYVVTRYTATGTHSGELMGLPATNRRVESHGCTIAQCRNGKLVHGWVYWDTGYLLRQLGALPRIPGT